MPGPSFIERPVLVAPDAFTGSLRASQVAGAIGRGLERAGLMPPDLCPVADGGEGTLDVLLPALGGELVPAPAGVEGAFALLDDGDGALVEPPGPPGPDSSATGALTCAAVDAGAAAVLIAAGRMGASDGGSGALDALDAHGGPGASRLVLLCPHGAVLSPRWAAYGAVLERGGPWILDALAFDERMREARAVVTGEGILDFSTLEGRLVGEIGQRTRQAGVPLHAVVGRDDLDLFGRRIIDLQRVLVADTLEALEAAGELLGRELVDGRA